MEKIVSIIKEAIKKEEEAYNEYVKAYEEAVDPEVKALFEHLYIEEMNHKILLESQLEVFENLKRLKEEKGEKRENIEVYAAKKAAAIIAKANEELKKAKEIKELFYSTLIHDLRTPVVAIVGFVRRLLADLEGKIPEKDYKKLTIIEKEGRRLNELVSSSLDITRYEKGLILKEEIDPYELVSDIVESQKTLARERSQVIVNKIPSDIPHIVADRIGVERVFQNLIENAIKYGRPGNVVEIGAEAEKRFVKFWVKDNGPGIPYEELPHIFEKFKRGSDAKGRGIGLGLAFVKTVVENHGGKIEVESEKDKGSIFYFTLPKEVNE